MNYSTIKYFDIANGEGVRTTLSYPAVAEAVLVALTQKRGISRRVRHSLVRLRLKYLIV